MSHGGLCVFCVERRLPLRTANSSKMLSFIFNRHPKIDGDACRQIVRHKNHFIMHFEFTSAINHIHQRYTCHSNRSECSNNKFNNRDKCRCWILSENWYDTLQQIRLDIHIFFFSFFISITFALKNTCIIQRLGHIHTVFSRNLHFSEGKFRFLLLLKRFRQKYSSRHEGLWRHICVLILNKTFCPFRLMKYHRNYEIEINTRVLCMKPYSICFENGISIKKPFGIFGTQRMNYICNFAYRSIVNIIATCRLPLQFHIRLKTFYFGIFSSQWIPFACFDQ